jgi:hypothetical protein
MAEVSDVTGRTFGRLIVVSRAVLLTENDADKRHNSAEEDEWNQEPARLAHRFIHGGIPLQRNDPPDDELSGGMTVPHDRIFSSGDQRQ